MNVYQVVHYVECATDEIVSTHSTAVGAALKAQRYATRVFRAVQHAEGYPEVQWDGDLPYWEWSSHKVYVTESELER
jgi:hypothetical protein